MAYKAIFRNSTLAIAIKEFSQFGSESSEFIVSLLKQYQSDLYLDKTVFENEFNHSVKKSQNDKLELRLERLKNRSNELPERVEVISFAYRRNPDVVATVLERANGNCERCGLNAPFLRKKDNSPYLEVHHINQLSNGGQDSIENAIALCPNCHKQYHFGII